MKGEYQVFFCRVIWVPHPPVCRRAFKGENLLYTESRKTERINRRYPFSLAVSADMREWERTNEDNSQKLWASSFIIVYYTPPPPSS
jgi:hypothetical protein